MICDYCAALKKYCKLHPFPCAVLMTAIAMWASTPLLLTIGSQRPIEYLPDDVVGPPQVRAGGVVYVTRHYNRLTDATVTIRRRMESGDCKVRCDRIDLASSELKASPGYGLRSTRGIKIPAEAKPGKWRLLFSVEYKTLFGRTLSYEIPSIEIEVIP
jgi:hypothetical protein